GFALACGGGLGLASGAHGDAPDLSAYFGFDPVRVAPVDDDCGPARIADVNGDGRNDLVIVNNRKSRIEIHLQRAKARTEAERERDAKPNEIPPSPWFDRESVSVSHRVMAFELVDVDGDGRLDIVYAGAPGEIVIMQQTEPMTFEVGAKRRVRNLAATRTGFAIADVEGDAAPELLTIVDGKIEVYAFGVDGPMGEPHKLGSDGTLLAFMLEDYNGDGTQDILGVVPEAESPVRIWLQEAGHSGSGAKNSIIGPELRFEMPTIIEVDPVRFADRAAASIATIERASRRIVLYDLLDENVPAPKGDEGLERDALAEVYAFAGEATRDRAVEIADINGDGLMDMVATDPAANGMLLYLQRAGVGLGEPELCSAFKEPRAVATGQWEVSTTALEVFVLSEEEKTVGVSSFNERTGRLGFPQPISIATGGASPVAMASVMVNGAPALAVVVRDKRDHWLEVHRPDAETQVIELKDVNRPPKSMLAGDFDHDGKSDLALFTPNEPMVMVRGLGGEGENAPEVLTDREMPQFGLVQSAGPENTAQLDIDRDGYAELLLADKNFVRACSFDAAKGWRVVEQITTPDTSSSLNALATIELGGKATIVASDSANERLIMMAEDAEGSWSVTDRLRLAGVKPTGLRAGALAGDNEPTVMVLTADSFAIVRLAGRRVTLEPFAVHRSDDEDLREHEIEVGDINGDGYTDLVVLDANEHMCQIYTLSATRKLHFATEFKVFEQRLFEGQGRGGVEPSNVLIGDVTGDGADDLVLECHDRYLIYPQMRK
ncbi:MAG: VCBS repeat-containing protein, partial [Phycisphaerales bacterium]|nr:VCBS repeat-containing protein [Phycisphaerales bacterium]